ncbi:hypothetical protein QA612_04855 [Evansella sp. AB-P1]|uniref:hypothetical protein n=1 Tax=Evansella sp. AB-P1 TaxID=3037653 RepID=UPI00242026D4|nr:hypothetical protein [Evansella sp. AB-P1]MDG5786812.1 hypothetical protein [Evansella sp. AB-P1]
MKHVLKYSGLIIFIGWTIAILVNFSIYQHTTTQLTLFHPIIDGILFMLVMLLMYYGIIKLYHHKPQFASVGLTVFGALAIVLAVYYYTYSF